MTGRIVLGEGPPVRGVRGGGGGRRRPDPITCSSMPNHVAPYTLAMVVCDQIYSDPATGKSSLLGTFTSVAAPSFPAIHPTMAIYVALTDGRGKCPLRIQLVDVDEEREPIFILKGEIEFADPRAVFEIPFQTPAFQFPEPGEYRLQLFCGTEPLMERRILLEMLPQE